MNLVDKNCHKKEESTLFFVRRNITFEKCLIEMDLTSLLKGCVQLPRVALQQLVTMGLLHILLESRRIISSQFLKVI